MAYQGIVMNEREVVEVANLGEIYHKPQTPYTKKLLFSIPPGWPRARARERALRFRSLRDLPEEVVDAAFAHAPGVGELAGAGGVEDFVVWREDHGRGNSLLDGIAVCGDEVEVAVEVPDVHLDHLELPGKQFRALAALDGAVQGAAVFAPVRAEDDEDGDATLLCGGERLLNGRLGVGRFVVWKRRGCCKCGKQSAQEKEEVVSHGRLH